MVSRRIAAASRRQGNHDFDRKIVEFREQAVRHPTDNQAKERSAGDLPVLAGIVAVVDADRLAVVGRRGLEHRFFLGGDGRAPR